MPSMLLFGGANNANGGAAVGALSFGDRLSIFGKAFFRIKHNLLRLAFYAVSFFCSHVHNLSRNVLKQLLIGTKHFSSQPLLLARHAAQ
jgi:hypothetical protein